MRDYTRKALRRRFASLDDFLKRWKGAQRKQAVLDELTAEGLDLATITAELDRDLDAFDLACHVAFEQKPLTRRERADNVKKRDPFAKYGEQARAVLDALLAKYADKGVPSFDDANVLRIAPFSAMGGVVQLINAFGGKKSFERARSATLCSSAWWNAPGPRGLGPHRCFSSASTWPYRAPAIVWSSSIRSTRNG